MPQNSSRPPFRSAPPKPNTEDMVFGIQSVLETLRSDQQIDKLYMEKELSNPDIQTLAFQKRVTIQRVPTERLDRFTRKNHQGVVCLVAQVQYVKLSNVIADVFERGESPFFLLLDRITDVRNFGAIARTAECTGIQCIVIPGRGAAAINADAMKTSSGALNHISVCREPNLTETIKYLQESGIQVVACTEKSNRDLYERTTDLTGPLAIVMGSEEDGISPELRRMMPAHGRQSRQNTVAGIGRFAERIGGHGRAAVLWPAGPPKMVFAGLSRNSSPRPGQPTQLTDTPCRQDLS